MKRFPLVAMLAASATGARVLQQSQVGGLVEEHGTGVPIGHSGSIKTEFESVFGAAAESDISCAAMLTRAKASAAPTGGFVRIIAATRIPAAGNPPGVSMRPVTVASTPACQTPADARVGIRRHRM